MTTLEVKPLGDLTPHQWKRCSKLNAGDMGNMYDMMREQRYNPEALAILLRKGRGIVGWGLLIPTADLYSWWGMTYYARKTTKYNAQLWIDEKHRRRGYGKIIMDEIQRRDPKPFVYPYDEHAGNFFADYRVSAWSEHREANLKKRVA